MDIEFLKESWKKPQGKIAISIAVLVVVYMIFESVFLNGQVVTRGSVDISNEKDYVEFTVTAPGKPYSIEVRTPTGKRSPGRNLKYFVVNPDNETIYQNTELTHNKGSRYFSIKPLDKGPYRIYVNSGATSTSFQGGSAWITVRINDHRVLTKIFGKLHL